MVQLQIKTLSERCAFKKTFTISCNYRVYNIDVFIHEAKFCQLIDYRRAPGVYIPARRSFELLQIVCIYFSQHGCFSPRRGKARFGKDNLLHVVQCLSKIYLGRGTRFVLGYPWPKGFHQLKCSPAVKNGVTLLHQIAEKLMQFVIGNPIPVITKTVRCYVNTRYYLPHINNILKCNPPLVHGPVPNATIQVGDYEKGPF